MLYKNPLLRPIVPLNPFGAIVHSTLGYIELPLIRQRIITAQGRRPPSEDILAEDAESYDVGTHLRDVDTPENEMLSSELEKVVFDTIHSLPEDLRTAITLRELEGLSYEEIAEIMDCPVGTVRSRIFRAREVIENKIQPLMQR